MIIYNIMHLAPAGDKSCMQLVHVQTNSVEPQTAHIRYEGSLERHRTEFGEVQACNGNCIVGCRG